MASKLRTLFWLGILMLVLSFIGIPDTGKMILALGIGVALILLSFGIRKDYRALRNKLKHYEQ